MFRRMSIAIAAVAMMAGAAYADPIEGNWKTDKGSIAAISSCHTRSIVGPCSMQERAIAGSPTQNLPNARAAGEDRLLMCTRGGAATQASQSRP